MSSDVGGADKELTTMTQESGSNTTETEQSMPISFGGAIPPLPASIAKAVTKVMVSLQRLDKGEENKQGGYKYASVEAFLEALRPLCAGAGLVILADEIGSETVMLPGPDKGTHKTEAAWFKVTYRFVLAHESGETWGHYPRRSVLTRASMGSQALGAAQSYAEKFFMRSLFKISTGDAEDADASQPQTKQQSAGALHGPLAMTALKAKCRDFVNQMKSVEDIASLESLQKEYQPVLDQCTKDLRTWWDGNDDQMGIAEQLARKRTDLLNVTDEPGQRERPIERDDLDELLDKPTPAKAN